MGQKRGNWSAKTSSERFSKCVLDAERVVSVEGDQNHSSRTKKTRPHLFLFVKYHFLSLQQNKSVRGALSNSIFE